MTDIVYVGNGSELIYGNIYQLKQEILTSVGPYCVVTLYGRVVAAVPKREIRILQDLQICPECGGRGELCWTTVVAVINPEDPYGEPIPEQQQCADICYLCNGLGRIIE